MEIRHVAAIVDHQLNIDIGETGETKGERKSKR